MMENAYYLEKRLDEKGKVSVKTYDVINWETNHYNAHCTISQEEVKPIIQ